MDSKKEKLIYWISKTNIKRLTPPSNNMQTLHQNIQIPKTTGKETIANSKLFYYIDSDFKNYGADELGEKQPATDLAVCELTEDMTFKQMFTKPDEMALTQSQILEFIEDNKDKLRQDGYSTFFLFKSKGNFFVAGVGVRSVGLSVRVYRFENDGVWGAAGRHRMVVPQLTLKYLSDTETLEPLVPTAITDEQAIVHLKANGYKITKEITTIQEF